MYINGFDSIDDIFTQFDTSSEVLNNAHLLYAKYRSGYEGDAYILYSKDSKLFEVHGSHCSCYGLEGQWTPEEVFIQDLEFRFFQSKDLPYCCEDEIDINELKQALLSHLAEHILLHN